MAKKKKVTPVVRPPTKRQLSHWQQQKRRQRIIFGAGMAVIAAVVILVGSGVYFGWYVPKVRPMRDTVAEVNGTKFSMGYFVDTMQYQLSSTLQGQWSYASMFMDPILQSIEESELIYQEAKKLGFTVSEDEIDEQLKGAKDINNQALRDLVRNQLLDQKLRDEYFGPQLPATADQRHIMAMFLESQTQLDQVKAEIEAGGDFSQLAEEYSLDDTTKDDKGDLGFHTREVLAVLTNSAEFGDLAFSQDVGALGQLYDAEKTKQVGYWLVKVIERKEDNSEAHVLGIMVGSEEEALDIKARIEAGEDFTALAEEYSLVWSEDDHDDFGWIPSDSSDAPAEFIFDASIPLNTVSAPIKDTTENATTKGGYWLIQVVAAENRDITDEDRDTMIGLLFNDWIEQLKNNPDNQIESYLDDARKQWATDYLTGAL